ncbi:hypothetical protein F0562_019096 [Nyssa sinensis]|uniref:Pectinesterase inhibitor domain-containing protein n=1 Tax=Nyssa sinensis TaxID=561372 RepID=A0A5J4ZFC2_9ASTE|nr:hypothetical protein F0562_019096 [Nyssa sinensis]
MDAQTDIYNLGSKCRNELERAAWTDCLELYQSTIRKLKKTVHRSTKCTQVDAQTWLSTALTNLETCQTGFIELGVGDYILPLMSNNVSMLISDTLAMNQVSYGTDEPNYKDGFPTWVCPHDRKLLQSPSPASQANIVVAQDGSGNYKTVNKAISAASKQSGSGREDYYHWKAIVLEEAVPLSVQPPLPEQQCTRQWLFDPAPTSQSSTSAASKVVFQNCSMFARNPPNKTNTVTAQGRTDPNQNTGISLHNCQVTAASDLKPVQSSVKTYLGRPWQKYSRTVYLKTYLDSLIDPAGWMPWNGNFALSTLYYGEYMNTGPGSSTANRVKWGGYHVITSATVASKFTVGSFIAGNSWLPATNVPFTSGL